TDDAGNIIEGGNFFTGTTADTIAVHEEINDDTDLIAASNTGASGDGGNATDLANVYTKRAEEFASDQGQLDDKTTLKSFYESVIGEMGVVAEESMRMQSNSQILRQQVNETRQSISSVS